MQKRANNVGVKKSYLGKDLCLILCCFVEKVSKVVILHFFANTSGNFVLLCWIFETLCYFMALFELFWSLGLLRSFVENKILS